MSDGTQIKVIVTSDWLFRIHQIVLANQITFGPSIGLGCLRAPGYAGFKALVVRLEN